MFYHVIWREISFLTNSSCFLAMFCENPVKTKSQHPARFISSAIDSFCKFYLLIFAALHEQNAQTKTIDVRVKQDVPEII